MLAGEQLMWHSHISSSLNLGLLAPMECVDAAVGALEAGEAPINAVEGFVRQVIGWREYVWGTYWHFGDRWASDNALEADGAAPGAVLGRCRPTCAAWRTPWAASSSRPTPTTSSG